MEQKVYYKYGCTIKVDVSIDPYLRKNLCCFIHMLYILNGKEALNLCFSFENELVEDSNGDKEYLGVFFRPYDGDTPEIKLSTVDYEELKQENSSEDVSCYIIIENLAEYCIRYLVWRKHPILTKSFFMETVISKIWEAKLLHPSLAACISKGRETSHTPEWIPEGMERKYIRARGGCYTVDMDVSTEPRMKKILYGFLRIIGKRDEGKTELRFSFENRKIKNSKGEEVTGVAFYPPTREWLTSPLIRISLWDFPKLKEEKGEYEAYYMLLYDIGLDYIEYCLWKKYPILKKCNIISEMYIKIYGRYKLGKAIEKFIENYPDFPC